MRLYQGYRYIGVFVAVVLIFSGWLRPESAKAIGNDFVTGTYRTDIGNVSSADN